MMRYRVNLLLVCSLVLLLSESASAQLFGERELGGNISRRQRVSMEEVGTVDTNRRFVRGQRGSNDFVGSDRGDSATFVGREQGSTSGNVTSSVEGLREQRTRSVNRPRRTSRTGRYPARLTINFTSPALSLQPTVTLSPGLHSLIEKRGIQIEVSKAGRLATLRGAVSSAHDRELAELLVLFEPGIEKIENELTIE
ncbi:MAG: BON domain-containing protein [Planctomycetaceae bacterium]|nr:BON domain-containing protein [Planctomycetaceae bacterium]